MHCWPGCTTWRFLHKSLNYKFSRLYRAINYFYSSCSAPRARTNPSQFWKVHWLPVRIDKVPSPHPTTIPPKSEVEAHYGPPWKRFRTGWFATTIPPRQKFRHIMTPPERGLGLGGSRHNPPQTEVKVISGPPRKWLRIGNRPMVKPQGRDWQWRSALPPPRPDDRSAFARSKERRHHGLTYLKGNPWWINRPANLSSLNWASGARRWIGGRKSF